MKSELKWSINEIIRLAGKRFDDKANAGTDYHMLYLMLFERLQDIEKVAKDITAEDKREYAGLFIGKD
jgi:hypothetical protein